MSQQSVAEIFKMAQSTLSVAIKRYNPAKPSRYGRHPYLDEDQCDSLYDWVYGRVTELNAATIREIQDQALEIKSEDPG